MTKTGKAMAAAFVGNFIFGLSFLFTKTALAVTTPAVLLFWRFLLAFAGLVFAVAGIAQYAASKPWLAVLSAVLSAALALFGVLELLPLIRLQKSIRRLAGKDA